MGELQFFDVATRHRIIDVSWKKSEWVSVHRFQIFFAQATVITAMTKAKGVLKKKFLGKPYTLTFRREQNMSNALPMIVDNRSRFGSFMGLMSCDLDLTLPATGKVNSSCRG